MNGKQLKNSILQWAIQGKLVPPVCRQAGKTLMTNPEPRDKGKECWFTYVIECEDGSFYKGFTDNLLRRYQQHCNGTGADYTKTHKPKQLYYWEMHYSKEAALQREKYLKSGAGREWFKKEVVDKPENFEPASVLLKRIRKEKERLIKEKKIKRDKNASIIYRGDDNSYYEKILATGEVKCIDDEVPFEVPQGWEWCRLNDLAMYRKGPFGSSLTKSMFVTKSTQSIKVYEQKNAIQKDHTLGDYYISLKKFETMQSFVVKPNDIIVSCAGTIGETYLLPSDASIGIINQALMRVSLFDLNMAEYWQIYFAYMLLNEAQMKGAGSAIKNIPPFEYLKAVLVPIPPLSEQNRLIERYNMILSLIDKYELEANKLNSLNQYIYDKLKKSVLQEAIQGRLVPQIAGEGTAQELLEQIKAEKRKLVKEGKLKKSALNDSVIFRGDDSKYYEQVGQSIKCIDDEIPFEIPYNWQWTRLSCVTSIYTGNSISEAEKRAKFMNVQGRYYIGTKDVGFDNKIVYNNGISIPLQYDQDFRIAPTNSILMCIEGGSAGRKIAVLNQDVCFGNKLCCFAPFWGIGKFIYYYLQSPSFVELFNLNKTGIIGGVSITKVKEIVIPLPPVMEQQRIVAQIDRLFEQLR